MEKNKSKKIKCVIIGAGYMAEEYVKAIKSDNDMELYGIYSRTFSKAIFIAKKYKIKNFFNSINEIKKNKISAFLVMNMGLTWYYFIFVLNKKNSVQLMRR